MSDLVVRIADCIKKKGTNFKRVEQECGLGNGTIKRWSEQSPRLEKLVTVAQYLEVSLDYLVFGRLHSETNICAEPSTPPEADLLKMFRFLDEREKEDAFDLIALKYEKAVGIRVSAYRVCTADEGGPPSCGKDEGETA